MEEALMRALSFLLKDNEGIYVQTEGGKFLIWLDGYEDSEVYLRVSSVDLADSPDFADGHLVWMGAN